MTAAVPPVAPAPTSPDPRAWIGWLTRVAQTINLLLQGKRNATTTVTLTANATTTTVTDSRIGIFSKLTLTAQTQSAAQSQVMGIWVTYSQGSAVINHVSYDATDQTFGIIIDG